MYSCGEDNAVTESFKYLSGRVREWPRTHLAVRREGAKGYAVSAVVVYILICTVTI